MTNQRAVIILSGGLDSTTLLYDCLAKKYDVFALTFYYEQRHVKEILYAKAICKQLDVPHRLVHIPIGEFGGSVLTEKDAKVPEGNYVEPSMKATVVPNRNMVMLSIAASYAISIGADTVFYGAHAGDHDIYPDCRPEFVDAMKNVLKICDYRPISLQAPFLLMNKGDIVELGLKLGVDFKSTWTCYNGRERACGKCGSCVERLEAFARNNVKDPIDYEDE